MSEDSDQDMDEISSPSSSGCEPSDDALKDWEKTNEVFSNSSSPSNHSRPESPDLSKDELDDQVGGLVASGKARKQKSPTLHRAHSVPSLVSEASTSSEVADASEKAVGLHRCNSLKEFLSGKVAALKKDISEQNFGKHPGSLGSIEKKHKKKSSSSSPEKNPEEATTEIMVEKTKLRSTLSDPTSATSTDVPIVVIEQATVETEKEDVGSSPDQSHCIVHRDVQGLVKSGTVKRQSRNFEEGKVNLPWDWEEALKELSDKQDAEDAKTQEKEVSKPEEQAFAEDEPPSGLVKMHAQKFQGNLSQEPKNSGSEGEEEQENKMLSPDRERKAESLFNNARTIVVLDVNSTPIVPGSKDSVESDRIKEEMQKARALFEQDVKKVNEDMIQEKLKRRNKVNKKGTDEVESQEIDDPIASVESQESSNLCKDVQDDDDSEDPRPGTVLKHLQAIEHKYGAAVANKSVVEVTDSSPKKTGIDQEPPGTSKKVYITHSSEEYGSSKAESPGKLETKSNEKDSFDVDVLLRRVNEDMRKEKEQRRTTGVLSDFKVAGTSSEDENTLKDITPENENAECLKEQDDGEASEIPRPGIVKRSTDLLLGKVRLEDDTQEETTILAEQDGINVAEPVSKAVQNSETADLLKEDATVAESDTAEKGLVKRHTLVYEGKMPVQAEEEEEVEDVSTTNNQSANILISETENVKTESEKTKDDAVDSSGIVSVKLRLKLMEEVIQEANQREYYKQRTRSALAALEDRRERIESEQIRMDSEKVMNESEKCKVSALEGDDKGSVAGAKKKTFYIADDHEEDPKDDVTESATEKTEDDLNVNESPCVGSVKLITSLLEERIHSSTEDLSNSKPGVSLRRHESMPRRTRPVDRPVVRQRSLSDLNTGEPSTSSGIATSTNRWSLDLRRDKNKIAKLFGSQEEELPDNDRDSEKYSDDMSEKSDKTDDCLSKPQVDIFELGDKDHLELSKEVIQIQDLDNKDIPSL